MRRIHLARIFRLNAPVALALAIVSAAASTQAATVVGRHIFYNNSYFDGNNPSANASDDNAIATDKTPLIHGQAPPLITYTYTSYSKGINGIMVDISGLAGTPTAADFTFKMGNATDPSTWGTAPAPTSITVRPGAGTSGSDRVTIIWADNAIQKQWLQTTVKATAVTGLSSADVFYFGNAIGDAINDLSNAFVNVTDIALTRSNPHSPLNPATITDPYDYNRDGLVNVTDIAICRANSTGPLTALNLSITP